MLFNLQTLTTILGILLVNAYTNVYLIIPGIFLALFVFIFRYYYISSARDIKRLEGIGEWHSDESVEQSVR